MTTGEIFSIVLQMNMLPLERNGFVKEMFVSCLKNGKPLLETRGNMPFNLQKTAHQKTLNLRRDIEILALVNEGKLLLHTGTKRLKK